MSWTFSFGISAILPNKDPCMILEVLKWIKVCHDGSLKLAWGIGENQPCHVKYEKHEVVILPNLSRLETLTSSMYDMKTPHLRRWVAVIKHRSM